MNESNASPTHDGPQQQSCVKARATGPAHRLQDVSYASAELAQQYLDAGAWSSQTLGEALHSAAVAYPERTAFVCDGKRLSFRELDAATDRVACALRALGLKLHDRALFQMATTIETAIAVLGCVKAGVIPVCSIPQYREIEMGKLAEITKPRAYFVQAGASGSFDLVAFAAKMAGAHDIPLIIVAGAEVTSQGQHSLEALYAESALGTHPWSESFNCEDVAVFQLSGGSTGVPKVIPRFHGEYQGHVRAWCDRYGMRDGDVGIWALPMLHNAGMMFSLVRTILYRATTVLLPQWEVRRFFQAIEQERVRFAFTIGPHAPAISSYSDVRSHDLSSLQTVLTLMGAEAIEAATQVRSINMYGTTEGLVLTGDSESSAEIRHTSIGMPCSELDEVRVLEPNAETEVPVGEAGELCFRGPSSLRGYYASPEINAASFTSDGLFRSGDLVRGVDVDGRRVYRFEGRMKDNINRGGEKFGTEDIEALISRHPAIADGKVVAMPDAVYGEKACAFLIARQGHEAPTVEALGRYLLDSGLAKFKLPERIETCQSFPITRVGKLDRAQLRSEIARKIAQETKEGSH